MKLIFSFIFLVLCNGLTFSQENMVPDKMITSQSTISSQIPFKIELNGYPLNTEWKSYIDINQINDTPALAKLNIYFKDPHADPILNFNLTFYKKKHYSYSIKRVAQPGKPAKIVMTYNDSEDLR